MTVIDSPKRHEARHLAVCDALGTAGEAGSTTDFVRHLNRAIRMTLVAGDIDACVIELDDALQTWLKDTPANVSTSAVARSYLAYFTQVTAEHSAAWSSSDADRYSDDALMDRFYQGVETVLDIAQGRFDGDDGPLPSGAAAGLLKKLGLSELLGRDDA